MVLRKVFDSIFSPVQEQKASRAKSVALMRFGEGAVWTTRNYETLINQGYLRNAIVYRCVRLISEAAANVSLSLKSGDHEVAAHPFLDLLSQPAPMQTRRSFLEELYGYLLVSGNAYVEVVSLDGTPRELHALRPDRMKVLVDDAGWVDGYEYQVAGRKVELRRAEGDKVEPVLHIKLFNPLNDHYGFAPIEAAQIALDIHNAAGEWNKSLLDNAACPTGALVYGAGDAMNMTDDQFHRLKEELESSYQGAQNAGRPMLLEGGLDWKQMGMSPKDMDFIELKNVAAREIALAFGVPPMLLGIPGDLTYANYQEANRAFWRLTVVPLAARVLAELSSWLSHAYGEQLTLEPDLDSVEALSQERKALWERITAAEFLTRNEKRSAVGYGVDPTHE
ncbi:Phage portal protein [Pseudovibrio axinellae]|uniref:Phage portal protein n=1 Tax=Pseudovibrio axinellae TaxID=989403 RepID=A0A166AEQ1_9HYPH|nr:phage portal protein [Pseudovibrio axinellae]KZL20973.1 Phage portal protein [Pseudovibrio axinellae]SEP80697.1 phage portal protein, HK97 family [Pseudovibrio axinellae]